MSLATTEDSLLGGRVVFHQPAHGYRAAIDPVLLAAAVPARPGQTVVDLGAGAGAATLCLAARVRGVRVIGVERNADLAALLSRNAAANGWAQRVEVRQQDIAAFAASAGGADHVMANPPFRAAGTGTGHAETWHNAADFEDGLTLADWAGIAVASVKRKGGVTFVQHADRLADLVAALGPLAGGITVVPLWPKAGAPARRVIVRARRGVRSGATLLPGLVLHEADGSFTAAAEAILRDAAPFA